MLEQHSDNLYEELVGNIEQMGEWNPNVKQVKVKDLQYQTLGKWIGCSAHQKKRYSKVWKYPFKITDIISLWDHADPPKDRQGHHGDSWDVWGDARQRCGTKGLCQCPLCQTQRLRLLPGWDVHSSSKNARAEGGGPVSPGESLLLVASTLVPLRIDGWMPRNLAVCAQWINGCWFKWCTIILTFQGGERADLYSYEAVCWRPE